MTPPLPPRVTGDAACPRCEGYGSPRPTRQVCPACGGTGAKRAKQDRDAASKEKE